MNLETKMKKYENDLQSVRDNLREAKKHIHEFEVVNGDFTNTIKSFENRMQKQRNFYDKGLNAIEKEVDKSRSRIVLVE